MRRESFSTPGPVALSVRVPAGEVEIEAADTAQTEVELDGLNASGREAVEGALVEGSESDVRIEIDDSRRLLSFRSPEVRARIRCPQGSRLALEIVSADARCTGRLAEAAVRAVSGDVALDEVDGELELKTVSGDARVRRVGGEARLNSVSGDLRVDESASSLTARTVSGNQSLGSVREGTVALRSVSGDVRVGVAAGAQLFVDASSLSGDMSSDLPLDSAPQSGEGGPRLEVRAKTLSGDVRIVRAG